MPSAVAWILRIFLAACFIGHGALAIKGNPAWLAFYHPFGLDDVVGRATMPLVGAIDLVVAALLLARPARAVLLWAAFWTVFTALLRPLAGGDAFDVLVRATNWGLAAALLAPRHRQVAWLALSIAALAVGVAGGASIVPGPGAWEWLEKAGVIGLPLALAAFLGARPKRDGVPTAERPQPSAGQQHP